MLAALVATETPPQDLAHAIPGVQQAPEAEIRRPADAAAIQERSGWGLARGLSREDAGLVWDRVLAVHGPHLSHAVVEVDSGGWLAAEELPADVRTAAARLRQLAADAQRGASWYQRARTRGLVRLDLGQPDQLDLLRRYGPYTTHLQVWAHGDPLPVIETADSFGDLPASPTVWTRQRSKLCGPPSRRRAWPAPCLSPAGYARPGSSDTLLQVRHRTPLGHKRRSAQ
jgi:hypothetical protein